MQPPLKERMSGRSELYYNKAKIFGVARVEAMG
jgi:hypothetical protein